MPLEFIFIRHFRTFRVMIFHRQSNWIAFHFFFFVLNIFIFISGNKITLIVIMVRNGKCPMICFDVQTLVWDFFLLASESFSGWCRSSLASRVIFQDGFIDPNSICKGVIVNIHDGLVDFDNDKTFFIYGVFTNFWKR